MGIQQETGRGSDPWNCFRETFGQVPGAHFHDKWVHYYNKNLLMMAAYFRGEERKRPEIL